MATRTFPIFRSLQRAIVGSAGVGKHESALAATARQFRGKEEEIEVEDTEKSSEELCLPDGYRLDSYEENDGIILDNPNTWPINSEKARQLRREFVQEGFRKLYNVASSQFSIIGAIDAIGNGENEDNGVQHEGEEITAELRQATDAEPNNVTNEDEVPVAILGNEDWLHYAQ
mmetsp:Transcript_29136/g.61961  ORF Transcript_29136/g.61961 Transcript_29136/m.61961 type:complete len:173 (+) Transcript_29136:56-574(+)|eukprot:CAMPEP_0172296932 /NCGR_PEP_ID=MMETSP1058-20130122/115_1 /TAXON_ID=83371 /ORGANISM="Detonula confervacea, Strain CCMP 353" /LENGTH=172 /DNA_ID=CAMNT_0013006011 /DNA_START=56 /DNA_END=574 /DNA_ORIENTATION=-